MTTGYIIAVVLAVAIVAFVILVLFVQARAIASMPDRAVDIHLYARDLLEEGYHGSYMIIDHKQSDRFLQMKKYFEGEVYGIELAFPYIDWAKDHYKMVWRLAEEMGLEFHVAQSRKTDFAFLYVDFKDSVSVAQHFCMRVFRDVLGLDKDARFHMQLTGLGLKKYPTLADHPKGFVFWDRHGVE